MRRKYVEDGSKKYVEDGRFSPKARTSGELSTDFTALARVVQYLAKNGGAKGLDKISTTVELEDKILSNTMNATSCSPDEAQEASLSVAARRAHLLVAGLRCRRGIHSQVVGFILFRGAVSRDGLMVQQL